MKKKMKKTLKRVKKWRKKATWVEKFLNLFTIVYKLCKIIGWLSREIPTTWSFIEELLKNLL